MERVQLFVTCLGDLLFPDAAADAELLLRHAGFDVDFPEAQVCCGQPAFNSGHRGAARRVARTFVKAFSREAPIVCPSGSCAAAWNTHESWRSRQSGRQALTALTIPVQRRSEPTLFM